MRLKGAAICTLALLITASSLLCGIAYAWNPNVADLPGTETSADNNVEGANGRFNIYTSSTCGIQAGEDGDSIAFQIKLAPSSNSSERFSIANLATGDQYEVDFTIGEKAFSTVFRATVIRIWIITIRIGTCGLYYRNASGGSWSSAEYIIRFGLSSGSVYTSSSGNLGFSLIDADSTSPGYVKFIINKQRLYDLGARGNLVTGIYAIALAGGDGSPGGGVPTPNDRCPAAGAAAWTLQGDIPDLPMGILLLAFPLIAIYAYLKRSKSGAAYDLKIHS